jgi:hypothetical protein
MGHNPSFSARCRSARARWQNGGGEEKSQIAASQKKFIKQPRPMRKNILTAAALLIGVMTGSAAVTVQGWWHLDSSQPITDSSGNNRTFGSAYSTAPATGGQFAGLVVNNGAGGPLDGTGWISTQCVQVGVGVGGKRQSAMWGIGYNPPADNYGIEIWVFPQGNGIAGGSGGWIFSSGQGGGVALRINNPSGSPDFDGTQYIDAFVLGGTATIGSQAIIDTNKWMHLAIVSSAGVLTFYTNGVPCGDSLTSGATTPAGDVYIGTPSDNQAYYGYLDEARMFTFAAGAFSTNDLLLRAAGPNIVVQPQPNVYVWSGGAAPFSLSASFDFSVQYQWRRGGIPQSGATQSSYLLPVVAPADSGSTFDCVVTSGGIAVTSSVAQLTVIVPNASDVAAYRNVVQAEPSLKAYFPVDNDTGITLTNVADATRLHDGTLELNATYDGRTNAAFGQRALSLNADGDVQIPNNPAFEFASGFGTIEGLVYLSETLSTDPTIFAEANDGGLGSYYAIRASANGNSLLYDNFNGVDPQLSWPVPGGLLGKLSHVAVVIDNLTNVTAYVNGQNLGTGAQSLAGFGSAGQGSPAWIGSMGTSVTDNRWAGTIDELAVYGSALSQDTIQIHYSTLVYGTNTAGPSIVSQPPSKTVFAGASPVLQVRAAGTLPLSYQWTTNSVAIPGATSPALALSNVTTTATYGLTVKNAYGTTNTSVVLTVAAPPPGYTATLMTDHPTALWRLGDGSGQPALDSAGFNDGAYNASGVTYGAASIPGEAGTAVTLDGAAGRAIAPYTPVLNPNGPLTVEFWAKLNSYGFWVPVSSMNRPARDGGYEFYLDGNAVGYEWHSAPGGYAVLTADFTAPTVGVWYHLAGIYDGTNYLLYINGNPAGLYIDNPNLEEGGALPAANLVKGFYIGSRSDDTHYWNGTMADVAFYNYALTQEQVRKHVFAGLALPIQMALAQNPNVVVDSQPAGAPHGGINGPLGTNAATWVASISDGTRTRTGVMQFSGTAGNQITLAANPDFGSPVGTIMFWMKSAGTVPPGSEGAILFDRRLDLTSSITDFGSAGDVIVQHDDGSVFVQPEYYNTQVLQTPLSGGSVSDGLWHHVAYVYDQSTSGSITLYVDGAQVGSGTYKTAYAWAWPAAQEIELGQSHDPYWEQFDGQMDDFRFYNRILTSAEVNSVFSSDALVDTTALKVRFNFDAAPGGLAVSWSPSVAEPQSATAATGPYVDQATGRTPILVPPSGEAGFFRAKSP